MTLHREILRLAVPAIVSNITTPLLGLVDTAITGHMGATTYLAAIAVGGSMFSLSYWVFNFLRMGTGGLTSQAYGAASSDASPAVATIGILRFSLAVAMVLAMVLVAVSPWLCDVLLGFMDADESTTAFASTYFRILIFGAPAVLGTFTLNGWFLGMQDSRAPMWMALVTNVVNIVTSLVLVYALGMKIEGVAIGTLVAQYSGFLMGLVFLYSKYRVKLFSKGMHLCSGIPVGRFFSVNTDIFLRTLCLATVTLWFTREGAGHGAVIVAANALLMQLFILFSYFMDGFAFAAEAMSGKYYGMGDNLALHRTIRAVFLWALAVMALFTSIYAFGGRSILSLLSDSVAVVNAASIYMPWAIAVPAAGVLAFVWDGVFIGMTLTRRMLVSMLLATATFFTICHFAIPSLGNHGLWLAFIAYLLMRGLAQTVLFFKKH